MSQLFMQTWLIIKFTARDKIKDSSQYRLTQSDDWGVTNRSGCIEYTKFKKLTEINSMSYNGYT